jgi:hypothetical protein
MMGHSRGGRYPFPHCLLEIILALIGDARNIVAPGKTDVVTGVAVMLRDQRLGTLQPHGSPVSSTGFGFGNLPINSENARRSSSVNALAISFMARRRAAFRET